MTKIKALLLTVILLMGAGLVMEAQTPLTSLFSLRGKTDQNGALYVTNFAAAAPDTPLTALGELRGRTDSAGALYVTCTGCGGSFPLLGTDGTNTAPTYSFSGNTNSGFYNSFGEPRVTVTGVLVAGWGAGGNYDLLTDAASIRFGVGNDLTISRRAANEFGLSAVAFASLGTPANGSFGYCSDCTIANPCAGGGTGAFAKRLNGVWVCN